MRKNLIGSVLLFLLTLFLFGEIMVLNSNIIPAIIYGVGYFMVGFISGNLTNFVLKHITKN